MPLEALFKAANYAVIPFWLLLVATPRWSWTQRLVHGPVVLLLLTPIYSYLLFGYAPAPEGMEFSSLYGVMIGFFFGLFVGAWETRDAQRRGIPHLMVVPCLIATLMIGPVGLLLYVLVRFFSKRALEYDEAGDQ
jgi:hypothetical protein